jgi:pimeloyl-ACP methyl ester carboxylesterase
MTTNSQTAGGKSHTIDLGGDFHYVDYGGTGFPLVLIHGLGGSHLNWMLVASTLAETFRVYAVDLPGFGLTPTGERSVDVRDQAALMARFVDEVVGEPAFIAGNSMGGLVTLLLTESAPHLLRGAILVDPALLPPRVQRPNRETVRYLATPLLPVMGPRLLQRRRAATEIDEHVRTTMDFVMVDPSRVPPEVLRAGEAMEQARRQMPWSIQAFVDAGRSIAAVLTRRGGFTERVHRIGTPVLLIHGDSDIVVPPEAAEWLAAQRPDWEFVMMTDTGHVPQLERPHEFVDLVTGWVAGVEDARATG